MTLKKLEETKDLLCQIEETKRRIAKLKAKATATGQTLTGMPRGGGIADKVGDTAAEIVDEKRRLQKLLRQRKTAYRRLRDYIGGVEDRHVQRMLELRYLDGHSWTAVALRIGGGNTGDAVRKACKRYVEKVR